MATSEDQSQTIVGYFVVLVVRFLDRSAQSRCRILLEFFGEPSLSANAIDSFMASGLDEPRPRRIGNAGLSPLIHRDGERLLCSFFSEFEVANQPDQCGNNP